MKLKNYFFIFIFTSFCVLLDAQTYHHGYQDGKIIFQLKSNESPIPSRDKLVPFKNHPFFQEYLVDFEIIEVKQLFPSVSNDANLLRTYQIDITDFSSVDLFIEALNNNPKVEYSELKALNKTSFTPNDTFFLSYQWGEIQVKAQQSWDIATGSSNVVVAITDDAIDIDHPEFQGHIVSPWNLDDNNNDPRPSCPTPYEDIGEHGTHTTGTVGALKNNNQGIASIASGVNLMPIKIGDCSGYLPYAYEGIQYAAEHGADIISCSWGGSNPGFFGANILNYAKNQGCIVVIAAGNDDTESTVEAYPAALSPLYDNIIAVAATEQNDEKAYFSNYGSYVDISAPGVAIASTGPNNTYLLMQGTSMATPMTSSILALMKSYAPPVSNDLLIQCLLDNADPMPTEPLYTSGKMGSGRANAYQSLLCLNQYLFNYDATLTAINSPNNSICGASISPEIVLKNVGNNTITSATISYDWGGTPQTYNWTGNLASLQSTTITLPTESLVDGGYTFTATIINIGPSSDENASNNTLTSNFTIASMGHEVTFYLETDCWGSETSWEIVDENDNQIIDNGPYPDVSGGGSYQETFCLAPGCYTFKIYDLYGDGMYGSQWQGCSFNGNYFLKDEDDETLFQMTAPNANFGASTSHSFCIINPPAPEPDFSVSIDEICSGEQVQYTDLSTENPTAWNWTFPGGTPATSTSQNPLVTYATSGTYSVTLEVTNQYGTASETFTDVIIVNSLPNLSVSASEEEICEGETTTLTASGASTYQWDNGLGNGAVKQVNPTSTTTYQVTGTQNGCEKTLPIEITVNSLPSTPTFTNIMPTTNICIGTNITYTTQTEMNSYEWDIPGENNIDYSLVSGGDGYNTAVIAWNKSSEGTIVKVSYKDNNGCSPAIQGSSNAITLPIRTNQLATNEESATCKLNGFFPIHFYHPSSGNYIGSINPNGWEGTVEMTSFVTIFNSSNPDENGDGTMYSCNDLDDEHSRTAYLGRNYVVKESISDPLNDYNSDGDMEVFFPFSAEELDDLSYRSNTLTPLNTDDNIDNTENQGYTHLHASRYDGNYEDHTPLNNCNSPLGNSVVVSQNNSGELPIAYSLYPTVTDNSNDNVYFASFKTSTFSEWNFIGFNEDSPLPITLSSFAIECLDKNIKIQWITETETNVNYFELYSSREGTIWKRIERVFAKGNTTNKQTYEVSGKNNGLTYFKLVSVDFDGFQEEFGIISSTCDPSDPYWELHPNPVVNEMNIVVTSIFETTDELIIYDASGRVIKTLEINLKHGENLFQLDMNTLNNGTYIVKINHHPETFKPIRFVKL